MSGSARVSPSRCTGVSGPDNDRTIFLTSSSGPEILGPHNDWSLSSPRWSLSGPEISGPENDQIVWSLSGPGRCLVLLHRGSHSCVRVLMTHTAHLGVPGADPGDHGPCAPCPRKYWPWLVLGVINRWRSHVTSSLGWRIDVLSAMLANPTQLTTGARRAICRTSKGFVRHV